MPLRELCQFILFIVLLAGLTPALGRFIHRVISGERTFLSPLLRPVERGIYALAGIDPAQEQDWKRYTVNMLAFSAAGFALTFGVISCQHLLPLNPEGLPGLSWHLALNTTVSFITNTNWQSYGGESTMSLLSQMVALTYQNFVSASVGMAVCVAVIRGISRKESGSIGNFWADVTRMTLYVLLPLSLLFALFFISQGVVQTFTAAVIATGLDGGAQQLAMGPVASQVAIKLLGTNGGGFFNANAAHPFENPTALSNFMQCLAIFLIPSALVFTLGEGVQSRKHAWTLWCVMALVFTLGVGIITYAEKTGTPLLTLAAGTPVPNYEGKEVRFGIFGTALFATVTTDASCGAVNAMHDSLTPLGGFSVLANMQLGEIIFGGVGSGLYGIIMFTLLTVFLAGLMVGRTPDYFGKRIEGREMTRVMLALILSAMPVLAFTGWAAASEWGHAALANGGAHGFTEILYAYTSATQNNGSAFAGLNANVPIWNVTLALAMLTGRFGVMLPMLAVAGSLAARRPRAKSEHAFPVEGVTFGALLLTVIIVVGALTFLPALSLGPIVEQLKMLDGWIG